MPVDRIRFCATSATRDARNRQVFVDGIRELLGVEPEVITGDEEAALSFAGASSVLPSRGADPVLVVDLGGGSTEFVLGNSDGVIAAKSVDIGCVRMTERHLVSDPPTADQIAAAEADGDRAGRLVAEDEGVRSDAEKDLVATDVGIDGAAAGAEEAAVHVVEDPEVGDPGLLDAEVVDEEPDGRVQG